PSTFGYNLLLFPWPQMVGGIFYEHSHRLIGALVGLLTLGLAATLWRAGGRLRWLGLAAVVVVVAQGVLGGLRVVLLADTLAIVTARFRRSADAVGAPVARTLLALLGIQLLLGVGSYLARFSPIGIPGGQTTMLVLPVAHRLAGSLILGAAVVLAVRVASRAPD